MDKEIWLPPEPEDIEDEMEGSITNYYDDDDDEFGDGTKWGKPSLSNRGEEGRRSYRFREENTKPMNETMIGKLKGNIRQLLKSAAVDVSVEECENWVDIITSLSWEAALFVKPDAAEGKSMDPDGYVKVKCVATGSISQSKVVKGLVFKKNVALKHMPMMYQNPRLLLIRGALGPSTGLSSFGEICQEDSERSIMEAIDMCQPNLVLVEQSVSSYIRESIRAKGMTLVSDMKLHRLERVARCTGSPILSAHTLMNQKLKQCDLFQFEQCILEHNVSKDDSRKQTKTLMFIEGCPTRLGCTILLRGTHSDALKRIKCVVRCAVVMAYHLIMETAFRLDFLAMFSTIPLNRTSQHFLAVESNVMGKIDSSSDFYVPISNGSHEANSENLSSDLLRDSTFSYEPYNPVSLSGLSSLSTSLKNVMDDSFSPFSSPSHGSISRCLGLRDPGSQISENDQHIDSGRNSSDEDKSPESDQPNSPLASYEINSDMETKDDISTVLDSESILVLMSSRNASRGSICEQSHFSHIKFYHNFDVPLGTFLEENLLNQKFLCSSCNEPPEAHFYYYAHHNKQLTVQVKRLPVDKRLAGETEGKLWMWSRCGKCNRHNGYPESTKRMPISTAARGLSFGKFLELSFSSTATFGVPSVCHHFLHNDFLYFFGLGPMVAMLRHSTVATYSMCMPPLMLEFNISIRGELLKKEIKKVYTKGLHFFEELSKFLQKIRPRFEDLDLQFTGSVENFSEIEEMLKVEQSEFETSFQNAVTNSGAGSIASYNLLSLNQFSYDIFLELQIWDQRLHSLISTDSSEITFRTLEKSMRSRVTHSIENRFEESRARDDASPPSTVVEDQKDNPNDDIFHKDIFQSNPAWFWASFPEIRKDHMNSKDITNGQMQKFEPISSYLLENIPKAQELITEEGSRMHIPLGFDDYMVSDYEDEFSSIIACGLTLLSNDKVPTLTYPYMSSFSSLDSEATSRSLSSLEETSHFSSFDRLNISDFSLVISDNIHPKVDMGVSRNSGKSKYSVVCLYANEFLELREYCCPSELDYIASLSRCMNWDAKGGKSKSFFFKTLDDRFIIKVINRAELESFMKFAPQYFRYMKECIDLGNQTCLAKILGVYQVSIRQSKNGKEMKHNVLVMENLWFGCISNITRQYDLKGALHARFNSSDGSSGDVLLDQNFVNDMNASPLYVSTESKRRLQRAVWNDTSFLNSINVMDYSLLVGVEDGQKKQLVCGIIDYVRQYTWDKQLETWVKSSLVPKNQLPTVISPKEYKKRFRKFITTYFLTVPDNWCN
ncbi:putative 1-phosphatidylinositol-3-phosphate 5-kinase FAB1D [Impatiens glandulifera]|uniref:putative 1-phosphatidylinositol-3-phosphate 5-kinase FAB1D n=1 Tax=Impatiens glandulifera TaxID=253017 RepID=UPI001FB0502E|nr:putative 1-phosphatidylinositol-3-phosphate 5-kinase FAB1D [Impatiens glandulifera]